MTQDSWTILELVRECPFYIWLKFLKWEYKEVAVRIGLIGYFYLIPFKMKAGYCIRESASSVHRGYNL